VAIAYDLFTRILEDPHPNGWGMQRAVAYSQLAHYLEVNGYVRDQYSVWINPRTTLIAAAAVARGLPQHFDWFTTACKGLRVFPAPRYLDMTREVRPNGRFDNQHRP
jgi:virulence-associated protein VapD